MKTETINVGFKFIFDSDGRGFSYLDGEWQMSCYAGSLGKAKEKLRKGIEGKIAEMLVADRNYEKRVMGCVSGEVLIVSWRFGSWAYDIAGDGRKHYASVQGFRSFAEACEKARDHAEQVWGGIKWEC